MRGDIGAEVFSRSREVQLVAGEEGKAGKRRDGSAGEGQIHMTSAARAGERGGPCVSRRVARALLLRSVAGRMQPAHPDGSARHALACRFRQRSVSDTTFQRTINFTAQYSYDRGDLALQVPQLLQSCYYLRRNKSRPIS